MSRPRVPPERPADRAHERFFEDLYQLLAHFGTRTLDVGSISAGAVGTFTITVPGAKANAGQVIVGAPSGLDAGLIWCGLVTADNTVTVRVLNSTGSPIDPGEATWSARWIPL
jgi:hypothetical protein